MTYEEIQDKLDSIAFKSAYDDEEAHTLEDELCHSFIKEVASGKIPLGKVIEFAKMISQSFDFDFQRWTA